MELRIILYLAVAVAIVLVAVFAGRGKANDTREHNYRALFIVGLTWIPIGLAAEITTFWILGTVFMLAGVANRDKWDS